MMYDVLYHFDGCSYTNGHNFPEGRAGGDKITWTYIINPPVVKDGNHNQLIPLMQRAGRQCFKYPFVNYSAIAKSNDMMFKDFIGNLHRFDNFKFGKVFIHWSHSERTGYYTTDKRQHYNKNAQHFEVSKQDGSFHSYDLFDGPFWEKWMNGIVDTMHYMYAIQEICKAKNIEWNFLTVENYNLFKYVAENYGMLDVFNSINIDHIFNWPTKPLVNYPEFNNMTKEKALIIWGTTGLPLQWAKAMEGNNLIDEDKKHLTDDGHKRFGTQILDWTLDRDKDISYWLDEPEVYNKSFFNDLKPWKEEYVGIGVHWLERKVQDALINFEIKPNADYIYES